jgi:hypothetical protein
MIPKFKRRRLWVDRPFQVRLLVRMAFYFIAYIVVVLHVGFAFEVMGYLGTNGSPKGLDELYLEFITRQNTLLITLLLVAPIMLYDLLKFSHRIAGPLFRCRKLMQEMAEGKTVEEFTPRKRDLMREFLMAFNELIREWNSRIAGANGHAKPETPSSDKRNNHVTESPRLKV